MKENLKIMSNFVKSRHSDCSAGWHSDGRVQWILSTETIYLKEIICKVYYFSSLKITKNLTQKLIWCVIITRKSSKLNNFSDLTIAISICFTFWHTQLIVVTGRRVFIWHFKLNFWIFRILFVRQLSNEYRKTSRLSRHGNT